MFEIGEVYNRRQDIHKKYGGKLMSGISPSRITDNIFLFTSPAGKAHGYRDGWISSDTIFQYSGEGQIGDQELTRGNLAIQLHKDDCRALHLFAKTEPGYYKYLGEFEYKSHIYVTAEDTVQDDRKMIIFYLKKLE